MDPRKLKSDIVRDNFPGNKDFSSFSKRGLFKVIRSAIGLAISTI